MRKPQNTERVEGYIYQHDLTVKQVQNQSSDNFGKDFIAGNIEVATDDECLNVIKVHFTYVTPTNKSGAENRTYSVLKKIIDENKTITAVGKENATKVRIDTALALNDFYNQNDELVSAKTNEGGFVTIINELGEPKERNRFTVDMVITGVTHVDADAEKKIDEHALVRGAIFNFRNDLLPVEFKVRTYRNTSKEWVITGTAKVPYDFGDESILTADELQKASADRQVYLADVKKRADEYKASRAAGTTTTTTSETAATTATKTAGFSF